jgi:hypothetical protein
MAEVIQGVIHGKTIALKSDPGIADGATVEVTIRPLPDNDARVAAILRTAGALANDPEFDAAMKEVERFRRSAEFREHPQ